MPASPLPSGALSARFRRPRVLIVGCGDIGLRSARALPPSVRVLGLARSAGRAQALRAAGITPLAGDLDDAASLHRLAGLATHVLHLAPPPAQGRADPHTRALLQALARRSAPRALVYLSTSGVYGDCGGAQVRETRPPAPAQPHAHRRLHAEQAVRTYAHQHGTRAHVLRAAGIYAPDRPGGGPRQRLLQGTPLLRAEDDVCINHIHANDLARACLLALWRGWPQRITHACDDSRLRMGEFFDLAADLHALPRLPRITRAQAQSALPPALLSFLNESRQLDNTRLKQELQLRLHHPHPRTGLLAGRPSNDSQAKQP